MLAAGLVECGESVQSAMLVVVGRVLQAAKKYTETMWIIRRKVLMWCGMS